MATISITYTATWLSDASIGNTIDDKVNDVGNAVRERLQNMGAYVPLSADAASGVLFISPDAKDADEMNIYGVSASAPDLTKKLFALTATTLDIHSDVTTDFGAIPKISRTKTVTIVEPVAGDDINVGYFAEAVTITQIIGVVRGSSTPSVDGNLAHSTDRSDGTPNTVYASDKTWSNTTTGDDDPTDTAFSDATIPAASFLWLDVTSISGTVNELSLQIIYKKD